MPMDGINNYVTLSRELFNHEIWEEKPFSKGQAWIDLIQLANYKDKKVFYKGEVVVCKRGDVNLSFTELGKRWGWNRMTVRRFIKVLEKQKMCATNVTTHRTTITLINYDKFNISCATNVANNESANVQPMCTTNKDIKERETNKLVSPKKSLPDKPRIPLKDKTEYEIEEDFYIEITKAYPQVDVDQELARMRVWCLAKPERKKTRRGVRKFISNWLNNTEPTRPIKKNTEKFSQTFINRLKKTFAYISKQWSQNNSVELTEDDWNLFYEMLNKCESEDQADFMCEDFRSDSIQDKEPNFKEFIKQWQLANGK